LFKVTNKIEQCWSETQNCWLVQFQAHLRALYVYVPWCLEDYKKLAVTQEKVDKRSKCGEFRCCSHGWSFFFFNSSETHVGKFQPATFSFINFSKRV